MERAIRSERGYTIVEFVLVASLLAVVLGATLALLDKTSELMPGDEERAPALREAQVGLHSMTRLLRQAHAVSQPAEGQTADVVVVEVLLAGSDKRVTFDCTSASTKIAGARRCLRSVQSVSGGPVSTQLVFDGVVNSGVFSRTTKTMLEAKLEVRAQGDRGAEGRDHRIVLDDGVFLRNVR